MQYNNFHLYDRSTCMTNVKDSNTNSEIDIVVLWVDGNDPEWKKSYLKHKEGKKLNETQAGFLRFNDWETLRYLFRGIEFNLPWIRKVHLITQGHLPSWLNINHPKFEIQTHEEIFFHKEDLPTFNSSAIELNILGISNLSEKFIYFNDDIIPLKPLSPSRFFQNDLPVDFLIQGIPRRGCAYIKHFAQIMFGVKIVANCVDCINRKFDK